MSWNDYTGDQLAGSEYGGVAETAATIQPKKEEALNNGDRLRLGYLTGDETNNPMSLEDRRQFYGLKPADPGQRPFWLDNTGTPSEAEIRDVGNRGS